MSCSGGAAPSDKRPGERYATERSHTARRRDTYKLARTTEADIGVAASTSTHDACKPPEARLTKANAVSGGAGLEHTTE